MHRLFAARDLLEQLHDFGEAATGEELGLVQLDERQSDAKHDFGALVEQTVPNTQRRLQQSARLSLWIRQALSPESCDCLD